MVSTRILIVEDSVAKRNYLTELVQIMGYHAHAVEEKTKFMAALHHYKPDLLLLGSNSHAGHLRAFADVVEREKMGTPILFIQNSPLTLETEKIPQTANISISSLPKHFDSADLKRAITGGAVIPGAHIAENKNLSIK